MARVIYVRWIVVIWMSLARMNYLMSPCQSSCLVIMTLMKMILVVVSDSLSDIEVCQSYNVIILYLLCMVILDYNTWYCNNIVCAYTQEAAGMNNYCELWDTDTSEDEAIDQDENCVKTDRSSKNHLHYYSCLFAIFILSWQYKFGISILQLVH